MSVAGLQQVAQLLLGQACGLRFFGDTGPTDGGDGGVGEDSGVVDAEVVEPGQRRQPPGDGRRRRGASGAWLRLRGEVTDPGVGMVAFCTEGVDAELLAPGGPGVQVAAVGGGGVRGMPDGPSLS